MISTLFVNEWVHKSNATKDFFVKKSRSFHDKNYTGKFINQRKLYLHKPVPFTYFASNENYQQLYNNSAYELQYDIWKSPVFNQKEILKHILCTDEQYTNNSNKIFINEKLQEHESSMIYNFSNNNPCSADSGLDSTSNELYSISDELYSINDELYSMSNELYTTDSELYTTDSELYTTDNEPCCSSNELCSTNNEVFSSDISNESPIYTSNKYLTITSESSLGENFDINSDSDNKLPIFDNCSTNIKLANSPTQLFKIRQKLGASSVSNLCNETTMQYKLTPTHFKHGCICGHQIKYRHMFREQRTRRYNKVPGITIRPKIPPIKAKLRD